MFLMNLLTTICLEIRKFIHFKKSKAIDEKKMTPDRKLTQEPNTA